MNEAKTPAKVTARGRPARGSLGLEAAFLVALGAATVAAYLPVSHAGYLLYDDPLYVTQNPIVQAGLTGRGIAWAFSTGHASNWHPITWLSHLIDASLFGAAPLGPHLVNVALHVANTTLLYALLRRATGAAWPSGVVATLFALHPAHVESVAWIAERKDVLSTFFWLATTHVYVEWIRRPRPAAYAALLGTYAVGLMTKPMLVTLPFTLFLLDYWPLRRGSGAPGSTGPISLRRAVGEKAPLFVLAATSSLVTLLVQRAGGAVMGIERLSLGGRVANALVSVARYLGTLAWPTRLAPFYPLPDAWPPLTVVGAAALMVVISTLAVRARRRCPALLVGWLWFLGTLVPVIGLVKAGAQSIADRYTYVPSIGLFIMVAWGLEEVGRDRARRRALGAGAVAVTGMALGFGTYHQAARWHDTETLFRHTLAVSSGFNKPAQHLLGLVLLERGQIAEAKAHFAAILAVKPENADGHAGMGRALAAEGDLAGAAAHFERALAADPTTISALSGLGSIRAQQGRLPEALALLREVLKLQPDEATAHAGIGRLLVELGELSAALPHLERAHRANPRELAVGFALARALRGSGRSDEATRVLAACAPSCQSERDWLTLAVAYTELQRPQQAAAAYQQALAVAPASATAEARFGAFLLNHGQPELAREHLERAAVRAPNNAAIHLDLARAHLATGQGAAALAAIERARALRPDDPELAFSAATALLERSLVEDAAPHFAAAVRTDPRQADRFVALARGLARRGRPDLARALVTALQRHLAERNDAGEGPASVPFPTLLDSLAAELEAAGSAPSGPPPG